jgi:phosphoribosylanthranilate isomerase
MLGAPPSEPAPDEAPPITITPPALMRVQLKICGITRLEDARYCAAAGADYLGFIQYEASPRYVAPAQVAEILAWVYGPVAVGVFVDAPADAVNRTAEEVGFGFVQLHGDETPAACSEVERPLIKAVRVRPGDTADALRNRMDPYRPHVAYFLLDTHSASARGGTGRPFDWRVARDLARHYPLFLAGGLGTHNLAEAVRTVRPHGIDLSSSLEEAPGVKDVDKLAAFFDAFQALDEALEA